MKELQRAVAELERGGAILLSRAPDGFDAFAAADIARVPMPSLNVYRDRLLGAIAHGDGDRDQAVLAREQARASGLE